jgi:hypothetical protein
MISSYSFSGGNQGRAEPVLGVCAPGLRVIDCRRDVRRLLLEW